MRALITTQPGSGHLQTVMPAAAAMVMAGHEVAVCSSPALRGEVEAQGLVHFDAGLNWHMSWPPQDRPWAGKVAGGGDFAGGIANLWISVVARAMLPDLIEVARRWQPDVIVRESTEFAGCVAAERLDIPHASVLAGALTPAQRSSPLIRQALDVLRADVGLPADPRGEMVYRYLHLCLVPACFFAGTEECCPTAHFLHIPARPRPADRLPDWAERLPDQPTVFVSLGTTAFVSRYRFLWDVILEALGGEALNVVFGVGSGIDPASFADRPANVHIEHFVPQLLLLPHCAAMLTTGSLNGIRDASSFGVPLVLFPIMGSQPNNAARAAALGFARVLALAEVSPQAVRQTVAEVLNHPSYARSARDFGAEMAALPGPEHMVALLEALARERRPLLRPPLPGAARG